MLQSCYKACSKNSVARFNKIHLALYQSGAAASVAGLTVYLVIGGCVGARGCLPRPGVAHAWQGQAGAWRARIGRGRVGFGWRLAVQGPAQSLAIGSLPRWWPLDSGASWEPFPFPVAGNLCPVVCPGVGLCLGGWDWESGSKWEIHMTWFNFRRNKKILHFRWELIVDLLIANAITICNI